MKNLSRIAISIAIAFGISAPLSAEVVPLFNATPITESFSPNDIEDRFVYDQSSVTVYCAGAGTADVQAADGGYPIVDNFMTAGDDLQSICINGTGNFGSNPPAIGGTNCFDSGTTNSAYWGQPIENHFSSDATASIDLDDGENELTIKLWDWGGVYGNTALELALPNNCTTHRIVSMCAGQHDDIGVIDVTNDANFLYVTFSIEEDGWYLAETHIAVNEFAVTKKGNPIPGQFPYSCELDGSLQTSCTKAIPLDGLSGTVEVAAHAAVFKLDGDGCGENIVDASEVFDESQGLRVNNTSVLGSRSIPESVFDHGGPFYSLGFGGSLTVGFGAPVFNGPGMDVCVQEVTNGRSGYPEELVDFYTDDDTNFGEVSNHANGNGYACVDLPDDVETTDFVTLTDNTDPLEFSDAIYQSGDSTADGYDLDWVGACYTYLGDETAWGAACYEDEGTRFVNKGNWGTFFEYEIVDYPVDD